MAAPIRMTATDLLIQPSGAGSPELLALPSGYYALTHTYATATERGLLVVTNGTASNGISLGNGFFQAPALPTTGNAFYTQPTLGLLDDGRFQMQVTQVDSPNLNIATGAAFFGNGATLQGIYPLSIAAHDPVITGLSGGFPASVFIRSPTNAVPVGGGVFFAWHGVTGRPVGAVEQIDDGHPAFAPNDLNRLNAPNVAMIEPDGGGLMVVWAGADDIYYLRQREVFGGWKPVQNLELTIPGAGAVKLVQLVDGNLLLTVQKPDAVYAYKMTPEGEFLGLNLDFAKLIFMAAGHSLSNLDVTTLDDGRFFAVWTESFAGGGLSSVNQIRGQMFAANGTPDGAALTLLSEGNFAQTPPHATVDQLADGRLAISYTTVGGALYLSLWDPRTTGMNEFGSSLNEFWEGSRFDDVARMRGGHDNFFGGLGHDTVLGGAGNDSLNGGTGNDVLSGGTGVDFILGGAGADVVDGGQGARDFLSYSDSAVGVVVRLWNGTGAGGDAQGDVISGIEDVSGTTHDDVLIGADGVANQFYANEGNDYIAGLGGDDSLYGYLGNDTLAGGAGADYLSGGNGSDMADYSTSATGVTVRLWNGTGTGGDAQGDRLFDIEHVTGSALGDSLIGDDATGNWLTGGGGADYLGGLGGADRLNGQSGNDTLEGGNGADQFVFGLGYGHDRVVQFVNAVDRVDLVGLTFGQFTEGAIAGGVRLTGSGAAAGLILDLMGVTIAQVETTDFI